ncbi:MAG: hypothetical protein ACLGJA_22700 [Gammaproteobacteria bacterium]|uniref:hypothetical protein n=1 Tax=Pseudomonas urmiensis TaxID=2745493 RepID=UPI0039FA1AED
MPYTLQVQRNSMHEVTPEYFPIQKFVLDELELPGHAFHGHRGILPKCAISRTTGAALRPFAAVRRPGKPAPTSTALL